MRTRSSSTDDSRVKLKIHYWALSLFAAIFAMISVSLYIFMRLFSVDRSPVPT